MGIWKHQNGEPVCAVCGTEKWKIDAEKREECCKTSPAMPISAFLKLYFGEQAHSDHTKPDDHYVPANTVKEFYEDYLLSGVDSLADYTLMTTVKQ